MKKFLIFLISTLIILVGCQSNKVNNDVYFDKIASISWLKPDENEVILIKKIQRKYLIFSLKPSCHRITKKWTAGYGLRHILMITKNTVLRYAVIKISVLVLIRSTSTKYPKAITIL